MRRELILDSGGLDGLKAVAVRDSQGDTLGVQVTQDCEPSIELNKLRKAAGRKARYGLNGKHGQLLVSIPHALVDKLTIETGGEFMKMHVKDKLRYIKRRNQEGTLDHFILGRW